MIVLSFHLKPCYYISCFCQVLEGLLGIYEFLPSNELFALGGQVACREEEFTQAICENILFLIAGYKSDQMNQVSLLFNRKLPECVLICCLACRPCCPLYWVIYRLVHRPIRWYTMDKVCVLENFVNSITVLSAISGNMDKYIRQIIIWPMSERKVNYLT